MVMQQGSFYLHEDEWAMIDLLPAENFAEALRIAAEAKAFGEAHFDGFGWTDMYLLPELTYPFSLRKLPLRELQDLLGTRFLAASTVQSGYSSYREALPNCFAFVEAEQADGAFYGSQQDGLVTRLHLLPCQETNADRSAYFVEVLHTLGTRYDLVLADWWGDRIIDLRERESMVQYIATQS